MRKTKLILALFIAHASFVFGQKVTEMSIKQVMSLDRKGETEKAIALIDSLRKTSSIKDTNYYALIAASAEINTKAFNLEAAIKDNEELLKQKLLPISEVDGLVEISRFKQYLGEFDAAIAGYKQVLQLDKSNKVAYNNMAAAYNLAGKYRDAIRTLNTNPNKEHLPPEYYNYALAYYYLDKPDSAKPYIEQYILKDPTQNDFMGYKYAAQIYSALHDKKKACTLITKANDLLTSSGREKAINTLAQKGKDFFLIKNMLKEIEETKKLKAQFCE